MIVFGFKSKKSICIRAAVAAAVGIIFIALTAEGYGVFDVMVKACGIAMAVAGVIELVWGIFQNGSKSERTLMIANAVTFIVLGLVVWFAAKAIVGIFGVIIAMIVFFFGFYQLIVMISAYRAVRFSLAVFVLPLAVTICGAYLIVAMFVAKGALQAAIGYVCGAALILYAISELVAAYRLDKISKDTGVDEQ